MRLSTIVLFLSAILAASLAAPAVEKVEDSNAVEQVVDAEPTTVSSVADSDDEVVEVADSTAVPEDEAATTLPSTRDGRQIPDDEEEDAEDDAEDDDDDDEDEEDEEEEEEEAARNQIVKSAAAKKNKSKSKTAESKPVPVLGEGGVEDDEAEDLGIFEREEAKSDEKASDEKDSDEDQKDEQEDEEEEESAEDEERDEPSGPTGLIAEPVSSERGDVDDSPVPPGPVQNEVEQPLAIAVVQREEEPTVPVVPVIVDENNAPAASEISESKSESPRKNKPKKDKDEDDDDEDEEDEEEEEEEEEEAARSEKVSRSGTEDVLYYYPYPSTSMMMPPPEDIPEWEE
jgi:exosome complex component RRP41